MNKEDEKVFNEACSKEEFDTRYGNSVIDLYVAMAVIVTGRPKTEFKERARIFFDKHRVHHEEHRWLFEPHPDWRKSIIGKQEGK